MRHTRFAVIACLFILSWASPPPTQAFTRFDAVFVGTLSLGFGLDYPCAEFLSTTGGGSLPCPPPPPAMSCLVLNGAVVGLVPNCHPHYGHNVQGISVGSISCVGAAEHANKELPPVTGPTCSFGVAGHAEGYCGLSGGQANGVVTFGGHLLVVDVHLLGLGNDIVVTGHYTNPSDGHHGLLAGLLRLVPPDPILTSGGTCLNKEIRNFFVEGVVTGVPEVLL